MEHALETVKAIFLVLSLLVAIAGLMLPGYGSRKPTLSMVLNCMAGGVVLSSALCHLLPDASEADAGGFPWAFALCGVGYLANLSLDAAFGGHGHARPTGERSTVNYEAVCAGDGGGSKQPAAADAATAAATTFGATTAMAVHALGDGAAIGCQVETRACVVIGVAIVIHKFFGALALGAILSRDGPLQKGPAAIFACATPAALVAAWVGVREDAFGGAFAARVTALCAGSLLYVCLHEILPDNLRRPEFRASARLAPVWAGFFAMTLLAVWA